MAYLNASRGGWLALGLATVTLGGVMAATRPGDTANTAAAAAWSCNRPQPVPAGFGYPASAATVAKWVKNRDAAATRAHGWGLFAALNTASNGTAVWQSWCTAKQAFADSSSQPLGKSPHARGDRPMRVFKLANGPTVGDGTSDPINFPNPPVYPIPANVLSNKDNPDAAKKCVIAAQSSSQLDSLQHGPQYQNNGDIMVAGVVYNDAAFGWLRNQNLYTYSGLNKWMPAKSSGQGSVPAFPWQSIVLKPMMWPVSGPGVTALPVWDDQKNDFGNYSGYEVQSQWPRAVAVAVDPAGKPATTSVTFLNGVYSGIANSQPTGLRPRNTYPQAGVVGIDRFYNYTPQLTGMDPCDRAILDASANYAYGRNFAQGDRLALIAMHIMTKEQEAWTFQSLWWSDRANVPGNPYAADRPNLPNARGPWRQYLMTSTYGWPTVRNGSNWPIAYNPYIELAADHPIETNCMNCHHRAVWPAPDGGGYLSPGGPNALQVFAQNNPVIFNGRVKVDALWSISDRVSTTPTQAKK